MSLIDLLSGKLTPDTIQTLASSLGVENNQAKKAIAAALPALLGGLQKNSSTTEGAQSLDTALDEHDDADTIETLTHGKAQKGDKILGHILGGKLTEVSEIIAGKSGLGQDQTRTLLEGLAPMIMGQLGKMKKEGKVNAESLTTVLSGESGGMQKLLGGIFDQDGDGDFDLRDGITLAMNFFKK